MFLKGFQNDCLQDVSVSWEEGVHFKAIEYINGCRDLWVLFLALWDSKLLHFLTLPSDEMGNHRGIFPRISIFLWVGDTLCFKASKGGWIGENHNWGLLERQFEFWAPQISRESRSLKATNKVTRGFGTLLRFWSTSTFWTNLGDSKTPENLSRGEWDHLEIVFHNLSDKRSPRGVSTCKTPSPCRVISAASLSFSSLCSPSNQRGSCKKQGWCVQPRQRSASCTKKTFVFLRQNTPTIPADELY